MSGTSATLSETGPDAWLHGCTAEVVAHMLQGSRREALPAVDLYNRVHLGLNVNVAVHDDSCAGVLSSSSAGRTAALTRVARRVALRYAEGTGQGSRLRLRLRPRA